MRTFNARVAEPEGVFSESLASFKYGSQNTIILIMGIPEMVPGYP